MLQSRSYSLISRVSGMGNLMTCRRWRRTFRACALRAEASYPVLIGDSAGTWEADSRLASRGSLSGRPYGGPVRLRPLVFPAHNFFPAELDDPVEDLFGFGRLFLQR